MSKTFDLTTLGLADGTHSITVKAKGTNWKDSVESNAVSYEVASVSLITFTVNGTSFQAEDGMTWSDWCDSEYNTRGYSVQGSTVRIGNSAYHAYITLDNGYVRPTDIIVDGTEYDKLNWDSGGTND